MRSTWALAAAGLIAFGFASFAYSSRFTSRVPDPIPSLRGWERITGDFGVDDPPTRVEYEFYVNPARPAAYEVVRYRITERADTPANRHYASTEKLQWDRDGRDVRRFECVPGVMSDPRPCRWREMAKDSQEYEREVPVMLWLYGLHHQALQMNAR
jgi:hypothetical protein